MNTTVSYKRLRFIVNIPYARGFCSKSAVKSGLEMIKNI